LTNCFWFWCEIIQSNDRMTVIAQLPK